MCPESVSETPVSQEAETLGRFLVISSGTVACVIAGLRRQRCNASAHYASSAEKLFANDICLLLSKPRRPYYRRGRLFSAQSIESTGALY